MFSFSPLGEINYKLYCDIIATTVIYLTQYPISCIVKNINNLNKGIKKMIDYNLVLYIGITLIVGGGVLFFVAQHYERKAEIELFKLEQKQQQLNESFNKNKLK